MDDSQGTERMGAAIYDDGHWTITDKRGEYLEEGPKVLESLEWQGIKKEEIKEDIEDFSKIIIVLMLFHKINPIDYNVKKYLSFF